MKALTWQGKRDVRVETSPTRASRRRPTRSSAVTSTAICGSDLHLYEVLGPFLKPGDILGHETMGIVEEVGAEVTHITPGDRVVVPFNISCGSCWMCSRGLFAQCETTQVREQGKGAALFGYTSLYGSVPGGQAEYLRVPQAHFGPIKVPRRAPRRALPLPVRHPAHRLAGGGVRRRPRRAARWRCSGWARSGQFCARIARHLGVGRVIGVDLVPERLALAGEHGAEALDIARRRRRRRRADRADRRPRAGRGHRRGRHGGARRRPAAKVAQTAGRPAARRGGQAADRPVRDRPARRAAHRDQGGAARRHGVGQRRLRRRGRPDADDGDVRPRHTAADGPVPTSSGGSTTSCRSSSTTRTRWAPRTWPRTRCPWTRRRTATRCSRRRRTAASRWC